MLVDTYCTKRNRKDMVFGSCRELATAETPLCKSRTGCSREEERWAKFEEMKELYGSQWPPRRLRPNRAKS